MSVPKYDELFQPALTALHNLGGSSSISEMEDEVIKLLGLTDEDITEIHRGNTTKLSYRLAWARTYLKKVDIIENSSRGIWSLTAKGLNSSIINSKAVKDKVKIMNVNIENSNASEADDNEISVEENPSDEFEWKDRLLEIIKDISPDSFERLCMRLLRESGFSHVIVTGKSGDGGIDGKGIIKIGGLLSFHVVFQCKRYKDTVSSSLIRDFRGAMQGRTEKGLILTTGTFTKDAKQEAQRDGAPQIDLIDGESLVEKLKELKLGIEVKERIVEEVNIKEEWFNNL
ncbi:restriction endonuclease [Paenibacillus jamilae]|uniref:Restriction endonuclease n=1 Tax=Paenibacillus jamilae TaxID=114136 RepID=A0ACC4ZNB8_9BACL|nr:MULTISPECIES: restriction endonuclease [Paenibacillus]AUO07883.1 restriction endonuclease [Paenibacillus sp. lzh-N1]KTS70456.1 restriction endonuclease [Paenibacillus jamilae]UQQ33948.1 restriction endonuclease [Paenibacillus polymyxa]SPY13272.1 EcoKMrr [Paenibacillus polymyxa]